MSDPAQKIIWSEEHQQFFIVHEAVSTERLEQLYVQSLRTGSAVLTTPVHLSSEEMRLALDNRHRHR